MTTIYKNRILYETACKNPTLKVPFKNIFMIPLKDTLKSKGQVTGYAAIATKHYYKGLGRYCH